MSMSSLLADPSIPDDVKVKALMKMGVPQDRAIQSVIISTPNETYKTVADPARTLLSKVPGGSTVADFTIPSDLESLGTAVGGTLGMTAGMPFVGAEAGGTLGGMGMNRGPGEAALRAAPGAVMTKLTPAILNRIFASRIAQSMSDKGSAAIAAATKKLFKRLNLDDLEPTPQGLANFFAQGDASPALQRASGKLANFRNILRTQPAFRRLVVRVPIKTFPQGPQGPASIGWHPMSLPDAMDYQTQLYGKGYLLTGNPRGGVQAEPDRRLGAYVRQAIGKALATVKPQIAEQYNDLSHDYGTAAVMNEVFPKAATAQGLLNHEEIYGRVSDPKRLSHLENLVGPEDTRQFLAEIAPGRQRIAEPQGGSHVRVGMYIPGTDVGAHAGVMHGPPTAPAAFTPKWPQVSGPVAGTITSQGVENVFGDGE